MGVQIELTKSLISPGITPKLELSKEKPHI